MNKELKEKSIDNIDSDKFVVIGVGSSVENILYMLDRLKSKTIITVTVSNDFQLMSKLDSNVKIYIDRKSNNEFYFSIPSNQCKKAYKKIIDFIKQKLNQNQKIIVVGHGGGYSREIYRFVLSELKNNGHSFKAIMPTPFSFEGSRRYGWSQETTEFLKNEGISVETFDYKTLEKNDRTSLSETFHDADEKIFETILTMIENWQ